MRKDIYKYINAYEVPVYPFPIAFNVSLSALADDSMPHNRYFTRLSRSNFRQQSMVSMNFFNLVISMLNIL